MQGYGTLSWPDGKRYEGEYFDDRKHGKGTFYWNDGHFYEGDWAEGKQHGVGSLTKDGVKKTHRWEMGKKKEEIEEKEIDEKDRGKVEQVEEVEQRVNPVLVWYNQKLENITDPSAFL